MENPSSQLAWGNFLICEQCIESLVNKNYSHVGQFGEVTAEKKCALCRILPQARDEMVRKRGGENYHSLAQVDNDLKWKKDMGWHYVRTYADFDLQPQLKNIPWLIPEKQIDIKRVKGWLETCEKEHGTKCSVGRFFPPSVGSTEIMLIDVLERKITKMFMPVRYVALSYVWGSAPQFLLVKDLVDELSQAGALDRHRGKLSQVVKDSMDLVSTLNEQYLWIDTLCIIQDDPVQKQIQISQMATIYNGALLTVLAAGGQDANTPLHGVRPGTRLSHPSFRKDGITLLASDGGLNLKKHTYGTRGWTYQEMILSQRRLYITSQIALFECHDGWYGEDGSGGRFVGGGEPNDGSFVPAEASVESYAEIVENYTRRGLTYQSDRLNACTGILTALQTNWHWKFLFGLPEEHFVQALLWSGTDERYTDDVVGSYSKPTFPSWSWLQGSGARSYPFGDAVEEFGHYEIEDWSSQITDICIWENDKWRGIRSTLKGLIKSPSIDVAASQPPPVSCIASHCLRFSAETSSLDNYSLRFHTSEQLKLEEKLAADPTGQPFVHLYDNNGAWCGLVLGIPRAPLEDELKSSRTGFLLISSYTAASSWAAEALNVSFWDDPLMSCYDDQAFEERDDDTVNAMLIRWEGDVAFRLAVAEIHKDAWTEAVSARELVYLA